MTTAKEINRRKVQITSTVKELLQKWTLSGGLIVALYKDGYIKITTPEGGVRWSGEYVRALARTWQRELLSAMQNRNKEPRE